MKKIICLILAICLSLSIGTFFGCGNSDETTTPPTIEKPSPENPSEKPEEPEVSPENKEYSITYQLDGGTNSPDNPIKYKNGDTVQFKPATKKGYEFLGWYSGSVKKETLTNADEADLILTAKWQVEVNYVLVGDYYEAKGLFDTYSLNTDIEILSEFNGKPVKTIAEEAFMREQLIEKVEIPESVISIGARAFKYCPKLKSINIPSSIKELAEETFYDCDSLRAIVLPSGLERLENKAFEDCDNLVAINIPKSVTSVGECFEGCLELTVVVEVEEPDDRPYGWAYLWHSLGYDAGGYKKYATVEYQSKMYLDNQGLCYSISDITNTAKVFKNAGTLSDIVIPEKVNGINVVEIAEKAFENSWNLATVKLSNNIETIGFNAFYGCSNIVYFEIGKNLNTVSNAIFSDCEIVDNSISNISSSSNFGVSAKHILTNSSDSKITKIGDFYFYIDGEEYTLIAYGGMEEEVVLPERINLYKYDVGEYAFNNNKTLKTLVLSEAVNKIQANAFAYCEELDTLYLCEGITEIGEASFKGCAKLSGIENIDSTTSRYGSFPKTLTTIGSGAFSRCNIYSVLIPKTITSIGGGAIGVAQGTGAYPTIRIEEGHPLATSFEAWISFGINYSNTTVKYWTGD